MSDSPQLNATGTNSAESPPKSLTERAAVALGKVQVLPELIAWESQRRGLKKEDDAIEENRKFYHKLLHGPAKPEGDDMKSEDDMGHIVLGDMKTEQHFHEAPKPVESPIVSAPKGMGLLGKLALTGLAAAGIGGPLGVGAWLVADAIRSKPAPVVQPETKTETKIETKTIVDRWTVGEPIVE